MRQITSRVLPHFAGTLNIQWGSPDPDLPYALVAEDCDSTVWVRDQHQNTYSLHAVGIHGMDGRELNVVNPNSPTLYNGSPFNESAISGNAHQPLDQIRYSLNLQSYEDFNRYMRDYR